MKMLLCYSFQTTLRGWHRTECQEAHIRLFPYTPQGMCEALTHPTLTHCTIIHALSSQMQHAGLVCLARLHHHINRGQPLEEVRNHLLSKFETRGVDN